MQQRGAGLEYFVEAGVGDSLTPPKFQLPQAPARHRHAPQPRVRDGRAAVDRHSLHRGLGTGPTYQGEQRDEPRVCCRGAGIEKQGFPELRLPSEGVEPSRDAGALAQGAGAQVRKYSKHNLVGESLEVVD